MMSEIHYPALVIDTNGWIELLQDDSRLKKWNYLGINNLAKTRKTIYVLDSNDKYWRITDIKPYSPLTKLRLLLANTIYNPTISVTFQERELTENSNRKFFRALEENIKRDDDLYTQFNNKETIIKLINVNQSYREITNVLINTGAI